MHRLMALAFALAAFFTGNAQHHLFRKVNVSLPSPECYRVLQDSRGIIWISTEQGLCRYDGQNTRVYNANLGLPEKAIYALREDPNGQIWAISKTGRILHITKDKIIDQHFGNLLYDEEMRNLGYDLFFQGREIIIPVGFNSSARLNTRTKRLEKIPNAYQRATIIVRQKGQVIPQNIFLTHISKFPCQIRFIDKERPYRNKSFSLQVKMLSPQVLTCQLNDRSFFSIASTLFEITADGKLKKHPFPHRILSIAVDSRDGIWIGLLGYGVYHYENGDFDRPAVKSLPGLSVSNILEDREQHIWCTTLEKGVFKCQQPQMQFFNDFSGLHRKVDLLYANKGEFLVSSRFNEIIAINQQLKPERIRLSGIQGEVITGIRRWSDYWIIGLKEKILHGRRTNGEIKLTRLPSFKSATCLVIEDDASGQTYGSGFYNLYTVKKEGIKRLYQSKKMVIKNFLPLSQKKFIITTVNSIKTITLKNGKASLKQLDTLPEVVSRVFYASVSRRIFVLFKGVGLYELRDNKLVDCNRSMHIPAIVLNDVTEDNAGNLWLASNVGLLKFTFDGKHYNAPLIIDEKHGLPAKVCTKVAFNGKHIAVSTSEGLITFPVSFNFQSETEPKTLLNNVRIRGKKVQLHHGTFNYRQNSIHMDFSVLSYHQPQGQSLFYTIESEGVVQKGQSSPRLFLQNLSPGSYKLRVFGQNAYGIRSSDPVVFEFTILPPFWATWWFIALCLIILAVMIALLIRRFKRKVELRAERTNKINMQLAQSQLSALQAQMNPHFLFNSISSIQNFIMANKREEAYDYLTSFSKLIRRTLNNSRSRFITLQEEIETIQLYMELEQRRYNNRFDFRLELTEGLDTENIQLPASLIQPLLENAVWHGVASIRLDKHGIICLYITTEGNFLSIRVTDNGEGIQQATSSHKSLAINIIEEQMQLLKYWVKEEWTAKVTLLPGKDGQGTEASFTIPILKKT